MQYLVPSAVGSTSNGRFCLLGYSPHETFVLLGFSAKLIVEGKLDKKEGGGLYKTVVYDDGLKRRIVYDLCSDTYRDVMD